MITTEGVTVVISTYTTAMKDNVLECINSLQKQTVLPKEILLVLDKDPHLLSFFKSVVPSDVKVISSEGFGLSNARNAGVKNAKGEIIAFIDDDAIADKDWLKNVLNSYSEPTVAGVGGLVLPLWAENKTFAWFPEELNWIIGCSYKGQSNRQENIRNPIGCNMSYRQTVFEKVGYFRQDIGRLGRVLLDGEEPEFSMRVHQTIPGSRILNSPSAVVLHKVNPKRMKLTYVLKRSFYQGYSKALINVIITRLSLDLDIESSYLNYLFKNSFKSRITRFYKIKNLLQLLIIFSSVAFVMVGFATGKVRKIVNRTS